LNIYLNANENNVLLLKCDLLCNNEFVSARKENVPQSQYSMEHCTQLEYTFLLLYIDGDCVVVGTSKIVFQN